MGGSIARGSPYFLSCPRARGRRWRAHGSKGRLSIDGRLCADCIARLRGYGMKQIEQSQCLSPVCLVICPLAVLPTRSFAHDIEGAGRGREGRVAQVGAGVAIR